MVVKKQYVTYLTFYAGTTLPPFYIGSTSEENINSGEYFGSVRSKKWKSIFENELRNNKHLFFVYVLSSHPTRKEALTKELELQKLYDVVKSNYFFNESLAQKDGFFGMTAKGINSPKYGISNFDIWVKKYGVEEALKRNEEYQAKINSQDVKEKQSKKRTEWWKRHQDEKEKLSQRNKIRWSDPKEKEKLSERNKERWSDPEKRKDIGDKISKTKQLTPEKNKTKGRYGRGKAILKYSLDNIFLEEYISAYQAQLESNNFFSQTGILGFCKDGNKKGNYKGFIWKFKHIN